MESISVLLTGGPGAGKSSAIACLRDRLSRRGFQVLIVPENATPLLNNSGGYDPVWSGKEEHVQLQQVFLKYQLDQEEAYRRIAKLRKKPYVLIHDRGSLDGRLFCTPEEWAKVLEGTGHAEAELLKRYDLVIHMTTCASGATARFYDYGPGSSNPSRYHNAEQAIAADVCAQSIYAAHPQVRVVPNFHCFQDKIETVVRYVTEAVHCEGVVAGASRERVLLPCATGSFPEEALLSQWPEDVLRQVFEIQITFLDSARTESLRRRCRVNPGSSQPNSAQSFGDTIQECRSAVDMVADESAALYEYRLERESDGASYVQRRVLGEDAYHLAKHRSEKTSIEVRKCAVCFTWQGSYYEICSYMQGDGSPLQSDDVAFKNNVILDKAKGAPDPPWLASTHNFSSGVEKVPKTTKLKRNATTDAALVVAESCTKRARQLRPQISLENAPHSRLEMLLRSPDVSKAAAVVASGKRLFAADDEDSPSSKASDDLELSGDRDSHAAEMH